MCPSKSSTTVMFLVLLLDLSVAQGEPPTSHSCTPAISHAGGNATLNCGLPQTLEGKLTELLNQRSVELDLMADLQNKSSAPRAKALARLSPIITVATQYARHHQVDVQRLKDAIDILSRVPLSPDEKEYESLLMRARYALEQGHPQAAKIDFDAMYRSFCPYGGAVPFACGHGRGNLLSILKALKGDLERLVQLRREVDGLTTQTRSR
jgi:hypothetical protein